jgi:dienelactone hydrolase
MKVRTSLTVLLTAVYVAPTACGAEPGIQRYELGQRLVLLDRAWDAHRDAAARARAVPVLKLAVPQFFAGKTADAAESLDRARLLLESTAEPSPAQRWAVSLIVRPTKRVLDPVVGPLTVRILPAYPTVEPPVGAMIRLSLIAGDGTTRLAAVDVPITAWSETAAVPVDKLSEGDDALRAEVVVGDKVLATFDAGVSIVPHLRERLDRLYNAPSPARRRSIGSLTFGSLVALLGSLADGAAPETNYPAARLISEAEGLLKAMEAGAPFYGPTRPGKFWLTVPTGTADSTPVRIFVPTSAKAGKPMPLVVALHGAGGSENLFFDAYGDGLVARLARERGWMVVAPRAGWLFDGAPPVPAIVDELAQLYPVDTKKVFVVGHSMGAMQSVALAQQTPGRFAAIAPLAGGGRVDKPDVFKNLPVFIGCGREDFLLGSAKVLAATLAKAAAAQVTFKEYPAVEHICIVQEALPEVFRFFDGVLKNAGGKPD